MLANANGQRCKEFDVSTKHANLGQLARGDFAGWWETDPGNETQSGVGRMAHGVAFVVDRLKAIGNGQVPMAAALAWELLS